MLHPADDVDAAAGAKGFEQGIHVERAEYVHVGAHLLSQPENEIVNVEKERAVGMVDMRVQAITI